MDRKRGIGKDGDLPWPKLKGDMRFFRELTTCPDRAAVEKRWGLKAEESADVQAWEDVNARMKLGVHPLSAASESSRNVVIMGRKTWQSLPEQYRPLMNRYNVVMSRHDEYAQQEMVRNTQPSSLVFLSGNIREVLTAFLTQNLPPDFPFLMCQHIFVIGGGQVFADTVRYWACDRLYVTEIDAEFDCDTFFPGTPAFQPVLSSPWIDEGGIRYRFRRYDRVG